MKNIGSYAIYGFIALAMILIITLVIIFYKRGLQGFTNPEVGFGNVAKEFKFTNTDSYRVSDILKTPDGKTDRYILNLDGYINIIGFKVDTFTGVNKIIKYRLKVENDLLNEYVAINGNNEFKTGEYYDIRNSNYNINQLLLMGDINGGLDNLTEVESIKFYGIRQFDKLIDEDIEITKNYDTKTFNVEFKKLLDVDNIEYYFVVIGKYDNNKEFLSKQIIRLNNNKINFFAELEKLVPKQYINYPGQQSNQPTITTIAEVSELSLSDILGGEEFNNTIITLGTSQIDKETTLKETAEILIKYRKEELQDVFKLILKNQYLETNKDVHALLTNINEYSKMKFLNPSDTTEETNESFVRKYKQNHYYYQSNEIKELLKFVFDMIENFEDACNDFNCSITSPQLDVLDNNKFPFHYKVGVGYVRLDVLGNEIYSPITSYRENGEPLFTMEKDVRASLKDGELTTGDNLFNKLKMVNNVDVKTLRGVIGSNYPNNFNISEQNLQDYVDLDEYKDNKYSPIQFNVNIIDENNPATTQQPTTTQTGTSSFSGNYKNAEETINDLLG